MEEVLRIMELECAKKRVAKNSANIRRNGRPYRRTVVLISVSIILYKFFFRNMYNRAVQRTIETEFGSDSV